MTRGLLLQDFHTLFTGYPRCNIAGDVLTPGYLVGLLGPSAILLSYAYDGRLLFSITGYSMLRHRLAKQRYQESSE